MKKKVQKAQPFCAREFPYQWEAILKLKTLRKVGNPEKLDRELSRVIRRYRGKFAIRQDAQRVAEVRRALDATVRTTTNIEVIRRLVTSLDSETANRMMIYFSALRAPRGTPQLLTAKELDTTLQDIQGCMVHVHTALVLLTEIRRREPAHRARHPYSGATMELIGVWENFTGGKVKEPKSSAGVNTSDSAEFVYQALKILNVAVKPSEARTSIKNALEIRPEMLELARSYISKGGSTLFGGTVSLFAVGRQKKSEPCGESKKSWLLEEFSARKVRKKKTH